jgi:hypothetical protein
MEQSNAKVSPQLTGEARNKEIKLRNIAYLQHKPKRDWDFDDLELYKEYCKLIREEEIQPPKFHIDVIRKNKRIAQFLYLFYNAVNHEGQGCATFQECHLWLGSGLSEDRIIHRLQEFEARGWIVRRKKAHPKDKRKCLVFPSLSGEELEWVLGIVKKTLGKKDELVQKNEEQ